MYSEKYNMYICNFDISFSILYMLIDEIKDELKHNDIIASTGKTQYFWEEIKLVDNNVIELMVINGLTKEI